MKHKVFKLNIDFEKEEKWLNEMAAKGYHFIHFTFPGWYLFEEGAPGEYIYRLEFLKQLPSHLESRSYTKFMEEAGVELVDTYFRWVWFRKKASEGPFDLYSDHASKIKHYSNVAWFVGTAGAFNLLTGLWNFCYGIFFAGPRLGVYFNSYISPLSFLVAFLCIKASYSYYKKIEKIKRESQIHE